jgi:hypothetical protein
VATLELLYTIELKVFLDSTRVISIEDPRLILEELPTFSRAHSGITRSKFTPVGFQHPTKEELAYHSSIKTQYLRASGDSHIHSQIMVKTLSILLRDSLRMI